MRSLSLLGLALGLFLPSQALAWNFEGNPTVNLTVDRKELDITYADVHLDRVRVHNCGGGYTDYTVNAQADLELGHDVTIAGGDLCGVTAIWGSTLEVGALTWGGEYYGAYTSVELTGAATDSSPLMNIEIVSGVFAGSTPRLYVTID